MKLEQTKSTGLYGVQQPYSGELPVLPHTLDSNICRLEMIINQFANQHTALEDVYSAITGSGAVNEIGVPAPKPSGFISRLACALDDLQRLADRHSNTITSIKENLGA